MYAHETPEYVENFQEETKNLPFEIESDSWVTSMNLGPAKAINIETIDLEALASFYYEYYNKKGHDIENYHFIGFHGNSSDNLVYGIRKVLSWERGDKFLETIYPSTIESIKGITKNDFFP